jgi:general secretion pathway protein G
MRHNSFPSRAPAAAVARGARGFTLIEILVVMALIGIVLAIVANRLSGAGDAGKAKAAKIAVDSIAGKIEMYSLDNGTPPQRIEDLLTKPGDADNWNGPYAKESELKDPWNRPYVYRYPGDKGGDFDLYSLGGDGKEGGEGVKAADIGNW